jgi:hypothetical protein
MSLAIYRAPNGTVSQLGGRSASVAVFLLCWLLCHDLCQNKESARSDLPFNACVVALTDWSIAVVAIRLRERQITMSQAQALVLISPISRLTLGYALCVFDWCMWGPARWNGSIQIGVATLQKTIHQQHKVVSVLRDIHIYKPSCHWLSKPLLALVLFNSSAMSQYQAIHRKHY